MITYAFDELKLSRIVSQARPGNLRSIALMKRLGMNVQDDPLHPTKVFGILENPGKHSKDIESNR